MAISSLLLIGAGNMGGALLHGWHTKGIKELLVVDPNPSRMEKLGLQERVRAFPSIAALPEDVQPQVVVVVVKPHQVKQVLEDWRQHFPHNHSPVMSMAAGITLAALQTATSHVVPVIRAMPNLPVTVGEGIFGAIGSGLDENYWQQMDELLRLLGPVIWLQQESQMDALTALSGSGPAYIFHLLETLQAGGETLGLSAADARLLALQTVKGAAMLAAASQQSFADLREQVTSPNGTTQAALEVLMQPETGFPSLVPKAMAAAARRSKELAQ